MGPREKKKKINFDDVVVLKQVVGCDRGDQMCLCKSRPKCSPIHILFKLTHMYITAILEKVALKFGLLHIVILKNYPK
jgi:hypothetical protein